MSQLLPQEIQIWYVLPVIRKELALVLIKEHKLSQKRTAEILGVSAPAISQYINEKRATDVRLTKAMKEEIQKSAQLLMQEGGDMMKELMKLLNHKLIQELVCNYHRAHSKEIKKDCDLCFPKTILHT